MFFSNLFDDSNDEKSFQHKLLLIDIQVSKLRKPFPNKLIN